MVGNGNALSILSSGNYILSTSWKLLVKDVLYVSEIKKKLLM